MSSLTSYWPSMSEAQREFAHALLACFRQLSEHAAQRFQEGEDISLVEPRLAPPRSSLDPRHFTAAHQMDFEKTENKSDSKAARSMRRQRQRADYRAKRNERRRRRHAAKV